VEPLVDPVRGKAAFGDPTPHCCFWHAEIRGGLLNAQLHGENESIAGPQVGIRTVNNLSVGQRNTEAGFGYPARRST
jgi:hypothetical protein